MLNPLTPFNHEDESLWDLHREIDRTFNSMLRHADHHNRLWPEASLSAISPKVDISETEKEINIVAELPGMKENDVNISVQNQTLTLSGEKKSEKKEDNKTYHRIERSYGKFVRTFPLPFDVKPEAIDATFEKGLLKISIPKPANAKAKPGTIKIKNKD